MDAFERAESHLDARSFRGRGRRLQQVHARVLEARRSPGNPVRQGPHGNVRALGKGRALAIQAPQGLRESSQHPETRPRHVRVGLAKQTQMLGEPMPKGVPRHQQTKPTNWTYPLQEMQSPALGGTDRSCQEGHGPRRNVRRPPLEGTRSDFEESMPKARSQLYQRREEDHRTVQDHRHLPLLAKEEVRNHWWSHGILVLIVFQKK